MSTLFESIYHHVPTTPCIQRVNSFQDAVVPDICHTSFTETHLNARVPSTPIPVHYAVNTPIIRPRRVQQLTGNTCPKMDKTKTPLTPLHIDLFKEFSEQVVPYTPKQSNQHHEPFTPEQRLATRELNHAHRRKSVAITRRGYTPIQQSKAESELSLFSGDDIFA